MRACLWTGLPVSPLYGLQGDLRLQCVAAAMGARFSGNGRLCLIGRNSLEYLRRLPVA